ncbi:ArpU family phage packaging/lysis transcriptional regulator [Brevibacillus sp. H7]|jgi:ArpU family phage transcriptional regulator|uniref:ArpU family phage packaging/lysis transcriptional regulator n=1 Tax=Brevibacillus sp. H7 TaxID=3349138 RepID=UPI0037FE0C26
MRHQVQVPLKVDRVATERNVKKMLDLARDYICMGFHPGIEAKTTAHPLPVPFSKTNRFQSGTEQAAVRNAAMEQERSAHVQQVIAAVRRLGTREQELILARWFGADDRTDVETYIQLNMTHASYYRTRSRAFYKLAFALGVEVYEEE